MFEQLLYQIAKVVSGEMAMKDLETWLLSHLQAILDSGHEPMITLANAVDADLIQLGERIISEEDLRERLRFWHRKLGIKANIVFGIPPENTTDALGLTQNPDLVMQGAVVHSN